MLAGDHFRYNFDLQERQGVTLTYLGALCGQFVAAVDVVAFAGAAMGLDPAGGIILSTAQFPSQPRRPSHGRWRRSS